MHFLNLVANLVGLLVILVSLIWSGFCLLSYLIRRSAPPAVAPAIPAGAPAGVPLRAAPQPVAGFAAEPTIPAHTVAVIAAAVYSMIDDKYKIISIKPQDSSWEKAGRQAILTSHRIR